MILHEGDNMSSNQKEFYTAGELACLFEIPKQTLLYYDKTGLLVPEFISANNYRHYSLKQYLILEIIINLRKLGIPVLVIKDYIKNRSEESFQKLLIEKEQECKNIIKRNQTLINNIEASLNHLQKLKDTHLNQITINYRHSKHFLLSPIEKNSTGSETISILAKHNLTMFSKDFFKERAVGWIIDKDKFLSRRHGKALAFFSTLNSADSNSKNVFTRPAGLYLTLRFQGTVRQNIKSLADKINTCLQNNSLKAVDNVYIMPLKNYWLTSDTNQYIYQLSLEVKACNNNIEQKEESESI